MRVGTFVLAKQSFNTKFWGYHKCFECLCATRKFFGVRLQNKENEENIKLYSRCGIQKWSM